MAPGNTSEPPSQKDRVRSTFDLTASSYDTVVPFFAHWGARLVALAELGEGERVLDLCCGTGASLFGAASAVGLKGRVIGIDLSPAMIDAAAAAALRLEATNVEVRVGDAEALDLEDRSVDAVLCGFGLMFFPDLPKAVAEMARVLRPGGRLIASEPKALLASAAEVQRRWAERLPAGRAATAAADFDPSDAIAKAGFEDLTVSEETEDFTFPDGRAYVDWCRSHGARAFFEMLDPGDQEAFGAELAAAAESERGDDGIVMTTSARFWRAVAAQGDG